MARDFIKIDPNNTSNQANLLRAYVNNLRQSFDLGTRLIAIMGNNTDGSNFVDIETLFGLPTSMGQTVFNLVNGSIGSMTGVFQVSDAKTITEQVG